MIKKLLILFFITFFSIGITFQNEVFAGGLSSDIQADEFYTPIPLDSAASTHTIEGDVQGLQDNAAGKTFVTGTVK